MKLLWACAVTAVGLLMFAYHHLGDLTGGGHPSLTHHFLCEMTGALGAGVLFIPLRRVVSRFPLDPGVRLARAPVYGLALLVFSAAHTSMNWGLRSALFPLAGQGRYDYGRMPLRYAMELPIDVIVFAILVVGLHLWRRLQRARRRELDAERLERHLAEARLASLRAQLRPHFLFNALHTVSAIMYRDVERADEILERLAGLLRASLGSSTAATLPLRAELDVLYDYLAIMRARFEERLVVDVEVEERAMAAQVPPFLLQPLVENAIQHGGVEQSGAGRIRLRAHRDGADLELSVEDDGPHRVAPERSGGHGIGLASTAERLALIYGEGHHFAAGPRPDGGFLVALRIPFVIAAGQSAP